MNINTKSWHYKLYRWTYNFWDGSTYRMPNQTNLCQYTQRLMLTLLMCLAAGLIIAIVAIVMLMFYLTATIPALMFGWYPTGAPLNRRVRSGECFLPYNGLNIKQIPFIVYPYHILCLAGMVALHWGSSIHYGVLNTLKVEGIVIGLIVGLIFFSWFFTKDESESGRLAKAYLKSKKQMICPTVTFDDQPTDSSSDEEPCCQGGEDDDYE